METPYCSGVPCFKDMAVELGVWAAWVMRDKGKL